MCVDDSIGPDKHLNFRITDGGKGMFKVVFCYTSGSICISDVHHRNVCNVDIPMIYILCRLSCDLNG